MRLDSEGVNPGRDDIIIEDAQGPELNVLGIVIRGERKEPVGLEPARVGEVSLSSGYDLDRLSTPLAAPRVSLACLQV